MTFVSQFLLSILLNSDLLSFAEARDRTGDLQIFGLTLSQLSYRGLKSMISKTFQNFCLRPS